MENRFSGWGDLDLTSTALSRVAVDVRRLWEGGEYRMKTSDIKRIRGILVQLHVDLATIEDVLTQFEPIAAPHSDTIRVTIG